jgi:serine/threonine protein kinase
MAAVKVCRRSDVGDERYERELRGAKLYSSIPPQEGLVHMREFAEEPWGFYAVMDLADDEFGGNGAATTGRAANPFAAASGAYRPKTLASVIDGEKALPLGECVKLAIALAKGLVALQRHHLLHRDIKPGNVLYVRGRPVLSDPGLVVEESEAASLVGTPGYVPPENFTTAASDVFSLGLTLKAASFGRRLEDLDKGPALEADTGAALFPVWWRILNKATAPTPSRRYQSAKALIKDLKALQLKMAVMAPFRSWLAREAIVVGVVLLIVFAAAKIYMWKMARETISNF